MRPSSRLGIALVLAAAPALGPAGGALQRLEGAALHAALLGAWCNSNDGGRSCWAWDQFFADGSLRACGRHEADARPFDGRGHVTVEGDRMCYRVVEASADFWLAPGQRYCTRILGVSDERHDYQDLDSGAVFSLYRRAAADVRCP